MKIKITKPNLFVKEYCHEFNGKEKCFNKSLVKQTLLLVIAFFFAINAKAQIALNFTVDKTVTCNGNSDGAATVKAINGTAPYTYLWKSTDTTRSLTGLKAGYHVVTATDANNVKVTDSVLVTQPGLFSGAGESLVYEETFTQGQGYVKGSSEYENWVTFIDRIDVNETYSSITLSGTEMTGELKLTDATAIMNLIKAIDGRYDHTETVDGVDWTVHNGCTVNSTLYGDYAIEINAIRGTGGCSCSPGPILRPGIGNANWGGFGNSTCGPPTQTMRIELEASGTTTKEVSCWRNKDGLISLKMNGGTRPFSYAWSTSGTDSFINSLDTGFYYIVATDANGCQYKDTFHILEPDTLTAHASLVRSASCYANLDGSATAIVTGGTAPFMYSWTGIDSLQTANSLPRGNAQVLVTDANGCFDTGLVVIPSPAPISVSIAQGSEYSIRDGDSVMLNALNPDTNQTYYWTDETRSGTGVWEQVGKNGFSASYAYFTSIKVDKGIVYAAYTDAGASNKATVMTYNGNKWDTLGSPGFSYGAAYYNKIRISNGVPYMAFADQSKSSKACVMKYNGAKWDSVGNYTLSSGSTNYLDLDFDGTTPYVAYSDGSLGGKATVRKFNGTNWDIVGTSGFTAGNAAYITMAVNNGVVFIGFQDGANSSKASVLKFDGTNWVNVGTGPVSPGYADGLSLTFNNGIPYLAFRDGTNSYKATVMSFDGSAWKNVGTPGFTSNMSSYNNLVFSNNVPYLSFQDQGNGTGASVMKFENNKWVSVGSLGFSSNSTMYNSLDIENDKIYVGFQDNGSSGRASVMSFYGRKTTYNDSILVKDTGVYVLTSIDSSGCSGTDTIVVKKLTYDIKLAIDSHVTCNGLSNGGATASVFGGTKPLTYKWLNADTTKTITGLSAGTYYFRVIDANQDTLLDSITITQPAVLAATALVDSNVICYGLSNAGATASAAGGTAPYIYTWSNSATTSSITGVNAGRYSINITDNNGCEDTTSVRITQPDSLSISLMVDSNVTCNGLSDGGITATVAGGSMPYTYNWSNSASTASITGVTAGTYTLNITDANGCTNNRKATITEPAVLAASVVVDSNVICYGDASGGLTSSATGGTMPYNYAWNNSATTASITSVVAGNYEVIITDDNGCKDTADNTVTQPSLLVAGSITGNDIVCSEVAPNKITELSAASGGSGSLTYQWQMSSDNTTWSDISGATSNEYQPMGTAGSTWYRRMASDVNKCGPFASNTVKITINGQPIANFSTNTGCANKQTLFTDQTTLSSGNIKNYAWSFGDKGTSTQQNPINVYKNNGSYTVWLKVITDSGCVDSVSKTVAVNPVPSVNFSSTVECEGTATELSNKSSISAGTLSYAWNLGDKNSSTATSPSHTYTNAGYYTVQLTATSSEGCIDSISKTVQVKQVARPNFSATTVCTGLNTSFTNLSTNASTYTWNFGNGSGTSTKENPTYKYATSGSYTAVLTATSADGCSDTAHKNVTVYALPTAGLSATEVCLGLTTEFTNSSKGATNYQWVFGNGTSSNKFEPNLIYGKAGSYTVELTATSANGCTDITSSSVAVNALPTVSFSTADICLSEDLKTVNTTTGASSYAWTFGDGSGSSATAPTHTYAANGNYKVLLVATSAKGCIDSAKTTINAFAVPKVSYTANNECFGTDIKFTNGSKIAAGTITYVWSLGDGNNSGNPSPSYAYAATGTYDVKLLATSNNGCKDSATSKVTVYTQPVVSFATADICQADALIITNNSTGGGNYTWSFGDGNSSSANAPTHNYTNPGKYLVKLEALTTNGCFDSDSVEINAFAEPQVAFSAANVCDGNDVVFNNNSKIAAGTLTYVWDLGNGATTGNPAPSYQYASNGSYTVKLVATSNNGCQDSTTSSVTVYAMPVVDFSAPDVCYGDTMFTNNLSSGATSYAWNFGDGATSSATSPFNFYSKAGNYDVQLIATTSNNCVDSISKIVNIYAKPIAGFDTKDVCDETAVSFANTSYGAIINNNNWSFGDGNTSKVINPNYTYASNGSYNVELITISDNACSDTIAKTVVIHPNPVVAFANTTECDYDSTKFTNFTTIASGNIAYAWNFGTGDNSVMESPNYMFPQAGAYVVSLKAVSDKGCERSTSTTVVVNPSPVAGISLANNCEGLVSEFTSTSTLSKGKIADYAWDLGDGNTSTDMNPTNLYNLDGNYDISLIVTTDKACTDTALTSITIYNKPTADFSTPDVCFGKLSVFTDASIDAQDYTYDFGDKWGISILKEPEYTYEEPGTYNATLYVTSSNGCRDTLTKTITIFELPVAQFSVNNHCFGEDFTPKDNSLGTVTAWNWDYDNGDNDNGLDPIYTYKKDGNYNVRLIVTDNNSCIDSLRKTVTVWPLPVVWVRADTLVSKGYTVPLEARGGVAYKWNPVDNLDRPLAATPIATVIEDITYTVTVANEFGCTKDTFVNLRMEEDYTLEPSNIMTPDGNGMNDYWIVEKAQYYNDVEVIVFDRWGRIVYQNANYDNTWGGFSDATGEALPDGAYYYIVKVPTDRETYKGSITIFR